MSYQKLAEFKGSKIFEFAIDKVIFLRILLIPSPHPEEQKTINAFNLSFGKLDLHHLGLRM